MTKKPNTGNRLKVGIIGLGGNALNLLAPWLRTCPFLYRLNNHFMYRQFLMAYTAARCW